jgi:hypothetical protein
VNSERSRCWFWLTIIRLGLDSLRVVVLTPSTNDRGWTVHGRHQPYREVLRMGALGDPCHHGPLERVNVEQHIGCVRGVHLWEFAERVPPLAELLHQCELVVGQPCFVNHGATLSPIAGPDHIQR